MSVRDEDAAERAGVTGEVPARAGGGDLTARHAPVDWSAALITSEIPVVAAGGGRGSPEVAWHTERLPAPVLVRLAVWVLVLLLVLVLGGLAVLHYHPTWLAFLRNTAQPPPLASATTAPAPGKLRLVSSSATGATYAVPASSYSLAISTAVPCWTQVKSPADASGYRVAETVTATSSPKVVALTGTSSIELFARAERVAVDVGSRVVGVIDAPRTGYTYRFNPSAR